MAKDAVYPKYRGVRINPSIGTVAIMASVDGKDWQPLDGHQELVNISLYMDWGYYGAECDQLAFAILFHCLVSFYKLSEFEAYMELTSRMLNGFAGRFVAGWDDNFWEVDGEKVVEYIEEMR